MGSEKNKTSRGSNDLTILTLDTHMLTFSHLVISNKMKLIIHTLAVITPFATAQEVLLPIRAMLRKAPPKAQNKTELQLPTVVVFNNTIATAEAAMYVEVVEEEKVDETVWFIAAPTSIQLPFNDTARAIVQTMTQRDKDYLLSHNTRRKAWHTKHGKTYVPLKWDNSLKAGAKVWAEHLLGNCGKGVYHDPALVYGECASANTGSGSWGKMKTTDEVVYRFVEREQGWQPPQNGHLTQVLWRSTKYVGCAEATKSMGTNKMCHTQVCRYSAPGNCNMAKYKNAAKPNWWLEPMLMDTNPCAPACPPNGCH